ncbi:CAP domain-containing protein [Puniceibacterium sp. IMCC21224]|uniref:CAP domain-containing protein n=1 Tax=Puniceibacterium sp. IMCC21224 TaxID=1618204 RepID=UPI00065D51FC|nr:CAP domain-containing protein [Puniceibacterium sp. IMCC21224]KMK68737.1 hypothetical protein IMCC21224_113622 [Puniceibacterium sp. IMCC21224]
MMYPSAFEQYLLELTNQARIDPQGEFDRLITDAANQVGVTSEITAALQYFDVDMDVLATQFASLTPVAPLAWSSALATAADGHTALLITTDSQTHQTPGEAGILARAQGAGFSANYVSENVYSYAYDALFAYAGFFIDWGNTATGIQTNVSHRVNIMNPSVYEVGIGARAENDSATAVGPFVVTQDFGRNNSYQAQIVGVVIDDADGDAFYDIGEGMGGVTVTVTPTTGNGGSVTTSTWSSGGYQIQVSAGTYTVTFSGGGLLGPVSETVTIGASNVKVDALAPDTAPEPEPEDLNPTLSVSTRTVSVAENSTGALLSLSASDPEGGALSYAISGADADLFRITGNTLFFLAAPDYESPQDTGANNIYNVTLSVTDPGGNSATAAVAISVTDAVEIAPTPVTNPTPINPDPKEAAGQVDPVLLAGDNGPDTLIGGEGDDTLAGAGGNDVVSGNGGNDNISGSDGNDTLSGGAGDDQIGGGLGNDSITGGTGNDAIGAGQGDDFAAGGEGNDVVNGGAGDDTIFGEAGNDTVGAGFNDDVVSGGAGDDSLGGGSGRDTLFGHAGRDAIGGGEGDDEIDGGADNDFLAGGGRNDIVRGGTGQDTINGGEGNDTLTGGAGADVFVFNNFIADEVDLITDFQTGVDMFRLSGIANAPGSGLAGKLDALDVSDMMINGVDGASFTYDGHTVLIAGVSAASLSLDDFIFS